MNKALIASIQGDLDKIYASDTVKPVCTPFATLGLEMVEKLPSADGQILVLSDLGLLTALVVRLGKEKKSIEGITFIAHTPEQEALASQQIGVKVLQIGYNNCIEELQKQLMGMKFDVVIGNPPYLRGLHINFLERCAHLLKKNGELLFIQPSTPFIKQGQGVRDFDTELTSKIKHIKLINPAVAFDGTAQLAAPLAITHMTGGDNNSFEVFIDGKISTHTDIKTVSIHSGTPGYDTFKQKMLDQPKHLSDIVLWHKGNGHYATSHEWFVELSGLVGDFPREPEGQKTVQDFFKVCFFSAGKLMAVKHKEEIIAKSAKYAYAFETKKEAENLLSFVKTKFARACLSIYKYNLHIYAAQLSTTPIVDFTRSWTDAQLFEHFELTENEKAFVRSMSDIYDDYSECMKEIT